MAESRVSRKIAAILSADVAGYTRLMGVDEVGTLGQLKDHRKNVIDPSVGEHGGRVVGSSGDGFLIEFPSAVDAVDCAVVMQRDIAKRNEDTADDRRMEFRIGINLGDVIIEDEDLFGDGVNIAARIQGLAESGGIYISGTVFDQVKNKVSVVYEDLGEKKVKNVVEPVHVYRLRTDQSDPTVALANEETAGVTPPRVPSIAVLPFDNMSGDPEQEFLADGISETTIATLAKSPGIFVIARNSTFTYKGAPVRVQQVAQDLGAQYVIEGSVQKAGNRVRITAQIVEAETGKHVWAERFDRTLDDIFALQDEIAWQIYTALGTEVTDGVQVRIWNSGTTNTDALDFSVKGYNAFLKMNKNDNALAREHWLKSTEIDPDFAIPWMGIGWTYFNETALGWGDDPMAAFAKAVECADKAMALDDSVPDIYSLMGILDLYQRKFDEAVGLCEKAAQMNPNHASVIGILAWVYGFIGRFEESVALVERSMKLSPSYQDWVLGVLGRAHMHLERGEEAVATWQRAIAMNPENYLSRVGMAAACGAIGAEDEARAAGQEVLARNPAFTVQSWTLAAPYKNEADLKRELEGLRKAGLPE